MIQHAPKHLILPPVEQISDHGTKHEHITIILETTFEELKRAWRLLQHQVASVTSDTTGPQTFVFTRGAYKWRISINTTGDLVVEQYKNSVWRQAAKWPW
jgi:hypothetical protein